MTVIKILPHSSDPLGGVKGQIFEFRNNSVSCQYLFTEISHADKGTLDIKQDFSLKA